MPTDSLKTVVYFCLELTRPPLGFISNSWKITSKGMFAGSCIGVILLVMSLEFLRRVGHEYDRRLAGKSSVFSRNTTTVNNQLPKDNGSPSAPAAIQAGPPARRTLLQHTLRSLLHMVQFGVAYFVMLLAMYYNGYIIICILIGSFLGSFVFSWQSGDGKYAIPKSYVSP
ncbi:copper transporter complex subunit Ctr4 [Emydomyces testavorans]|uniref:Copper transport protein n=1 Tax=Emydomyces testavorans TaxID=2070801 RepID=A0AAF0IJN5_9EURO|nr:copper transporter complex subunit Ctr4 [Emydomyces testavorans]